MFFLQMVIPNVTFNVRRAPYGCDMVTEERPYMLTEEERPYMLTEEQPYGASYIEGCLF